MIVDVHSHAWRFPQDFSEDFIRQAQRARAGQPVDLAVRYEDYAASARVHAPSGQWLTVHASRLDDVERSVAVVVEPTSPVALAPLVIAAYGLTAREGEVTRRLLTGLARKTIASELRISMHTVNDHVKAVFDKTGASSAGELRARVFRDGASLTR